VGRRCTQCAGHEGAQGATFAGSIHERGASHQTHAVADIYLVLFAKSGVAGVAAATTATQYLAAAYFLLYLFRGRYSASALRLKWMVCAWE
jgi:Na+-driven multidrug efflux pump